jgi:O-antigen/teichoic acid export membrane protein
MSLSLALLLALSSSFIASFFGDERLQPLLLLSSLTFPFVALGQQLRMTAEKALEFRSVVIIEVISLAIGFAASLAAVLAGFGVYSLVYGNLLTVASMSILAWIVLANNWRPLWRFRYSDIRSLLGFGSAVVANGLVGHINMIIDILIGGKMLIASQLGLYSAPRSLILQLHFIVNPIIARVGFPLIAEVQADIPRVRSIYLQMVSMSAAISAPLCIGISMFSSEVTEIVLGPGWEDSGILLCLLAIWGFVRTTQSHTQSLLLGMGRAGLALKWNLGLLFFLIPATWAGASVGPLGLVVALLSVQLTLVIPNWYFLIRPVCNAGMVEYLYCILRPTIIAFFALLMGYLSVGGMELPVLRLGVAVVTSGAFYLLLSMKFNKDWFDAMKSLLGQ